MLKVYIGVVLFAASFFNYAETNEINVGKFETVKSTILNDSKKVMISLPDYYDANDYSYPVLYFTDASHHFFTMASTVHFLTRSDLIPPMIVVGIDSGKHRTRDLTPQLSAQTLNTSKRYSSENSGGADKFIQFIGTELIPHINKQYRTADFNVFAGHSLGGLFSLYVLANHSSFFDGFISVSPSLWWDEERLFNDIKQQVGQNNFPKKPLFMSKGSEQGPMETTYQTLADLFEVDKRELVSTKKFPEENHLTVVFKAYYEGLQAIFSQWVLPYKEGAKGLDVVKAHNKKVKSLFNLNFTSERWLVNLGNSELNSKKRYDKAIAAFSLNTELFPQSAYSYFQLAKALEAKNDLVSAFENYKKANDLVPESYYTKHIYQENLKRIKALL